MGALRAFMELLIEGFDSADGSFAKRKAIRAKRYPGGQEPTGYTTKGEGTWPRRR
jgi:hypothetical protein